MTMSAVISGSKSVYDKVVGMLKNDYWLFQQLAFSFLKQNMLHLL